MMLQDLSLWTLLGGALCLGALYGWYAWRLQRETFWQMNRFFLLLTPFLAMLIPHWQLPVHLAPPESEALDPALWLLVLEARQEAREWFPPPADSSGILVGQALIWLYLFGFTARLGVSFCQCFRLIAIVWQGRRQDTGACILVTHPKAPGPASFFRYVFSSGSVLMPRMVLEHELVHVRQWHSLDILLMEIGVALHWYNPLVYRLRAQLRLTHEYIADAAVVTAQPDGAYAYARLLVHQSQNQLPMLYNTFAAQISSRLRMLAQRPSGIWRLLEHAVALPLGASLVFVFSLQAIEQTPMLAPFKALVETLESTSVLETEAPKAQVSFPVAQAPEETAFREPMGNLAALPPVRMTLPQNLAALRLDSLPVPIQYAVPEKGIVIRGDMSRLDTTKTPLYVLDGVVIENIEGISPESIKAITVLKGESAIALYGERGQDGVIVITTVNGPKPPKAAANPSGDDTFLTGKLVKVKPKPGEAGKGRTYFQADSIRIEGYATEGKITQPALLQITSGGKLIGEIENTGKKDFPKSDQVLPDIRSIQIIRGEQAVQKFGPKAEKGVMIMEIPNRRSAERAYKYYLDQQKK